MTLKTRAKVIDIKRKSTSPCFKNLVVGDVIEFSIPMKSVGYSSRGTHAAFITCHNNRTGNTSELSFNMLGNTLNCCKLEELD